MRDSTVFVGIDYATAFVQVCVLDADGRVLGNRRCENDWGAIARYAGGFGRHVRAAIEACGGTADLAEQLLRYAGWSIDLGHPGYVARIKQSPDKTDFSDARLLADLVRVGYLPRVWLAPAPIRELRRLVRYRQDEVNRRRALKLRTTALLRDHRLKTDSNAWTQRWVRWLREVELPAESRWIVDRTQEELAEVDKRIVAAEQRLEQAVADDPYVQRMRAIKGIGLVTACVLRAEIGDPSRFKTGKQLARFCGLSPRNASSGQRQADAGLIAACNKQLRATLMEAAHRLKRFDARWATLASRLKARGKPGSVIAAAVANRWVRGLFHELLAVRTVA